MKKILKISFCLVILGFSIFILSNKTIRTTLNSFIESGKTLDSYTIKGIDVSHHQGKIHWQKVANQNIKFAFIKSTQGSKFKDKSYLYNSENAKQHNILVGAYHYYIVKENPINQFNNFVKNTPKSSFNLVPVIDIEYTCNPQLYNKNYHKTFLEQFKKFEKLISEYYGVKPIFYTSGDLYVKLLRNNFSNKVWICDYSNKKLWYLTKDEFLFWQHSNTGKIKGVST